MNLVFDTKRFGLASNKKFVETRYTLLKIFVGVFVFSLVLLPFMLGLIQGSRNEIDFVINVEEFNRIRLAVLFALISMSFGIYFYGSNNHISKERFIDSLKLPNSVFEKWLLDVLSTFLFIVIILGIFCVADYVIVSTFLTETPLPYKDYLFKPFSDDNVIFLAVILIIGIIINVLSTIHGNEKGKGVWIFYTWFGALYGLNIGLNYLFFGSDIAIGKKFASFPFSQLMTYVLMPIAILLGLIYFFRLKEKEV